MTDQATNDRYIIAQEQYPDPSESQDRIATARQSLDAQLDNTLSEWKSQEAPISPELQSCIDSMKTAFEDYYSRLGIPKEKIKFPNHIIRLATHTISGDNGRSIGDIVAFGNQDNIEDTELRNFVEAKLLAHEIYHNIGQTKFRILTGDKDEDLNIQERSGLSYQSLRRRRNYPSALEEGMATEMEEYMTEAVIKKSFPKAYERYKKFQEIYQSSGFALDPNDYKFLTPQKDFDDESKMKFYLTPSPNIQGYNLIEYLKEVEMEETGSSTNLIQIIEKARLLGETLPFARYIRNRFGRTSFDDVARADINNGNQVVAKLKEGRLQK
jgi:hypothetical protein